MRGVYSVCVLLQASSLLGLAPVHERPVLGGAGICSDVECSPPTCKFPVLQPGKCCLSCPTERIVDELPSRIDANRGHNIRIRKADRSRIMENWDRRISRHEGFAVALRQLGFPPTTRGPPTTTFCPYPCTHQGRHYCHPLPCHITCVDGVKPPGGCCYECPNGPNCSYMGHVIPEGQNVTMASGVVVECYSGDVYGGNIGVHRPPVVG